VLGVAVVSLRCWQPTSAASTAAAAAVIMNRFILALLCSGSSGRQRCVDSRFGAKARASQQLHATSPCNA
jgi:hypothetical protein